MTIQDLLQSDPSQPLVNQGQARIADKRDDRAIAELQAELRTFVCEGQYADGIAKIVESFLKNLAHTSQRAAWVSGFFGSGKSHLLKMLAHLWVDTVFPDGSTARSLVPAMPDDLRSAFRELDTAGKRAGGLAAAAGSLPSGSTDLVRQTVLGVLLRGVGLPDQYPQAQFVLWLREHGYFDTVKGEVIKAGKVWEAELNNLYVSGHIARGVLACDGKFAANEIEARKTIREQFPKRDTDIPTADFLRVAKQALRQAGRDGRFPCTVLILDEAQQYIGDSNDRSVLFTEVAEAVSKELDSQVVLVAAGQSALTGVPLLQKLMDRFTIRVPLSDTDVETVTRRVLLQKKPAAVPVVRDELNKYSGEVSRQLQGTRIGEIGSDAKIIVDDYPLLPVRRRFWEHCFRQIDAAGTSSQLRSQLRIIHDAVAKLAGRPLGALVPGDELFDALAPEMVNTGVLLRELNEKIIALSPDWKAGDPLARRICGLIFLISKLPREAGADIGVRTAKEHLADLLVNDLRGDNGKLRDDVESTLNRLVTLGVLMPVENEFRLQTREGSEWDREFKNRQTKLTADAADVQIRRNSLLYADIDRFVRAQKVVQGAAKESRELLVSRDQTPPEVAGTGIPVWARDEWSASEKSMVDAARSAGSESPIIYVFIPRLSAEDLRRWIIDAAAAEQTIESKGVPATPEGAEAKRSMESRLALAIKNRDGLVREIVGSAKVFQGGGTEMLQLTLDAKLKDAITSSLARLFPRFGEADSAAWKVAMQRARDGADQPFGPVGHSGATEQHPVCQEVLSRIGMGKTGTALRKELEAAPFGWPRDAIDAALIALHRSQHVRVTLNGAHISAGQLDQNKIPKSEFRVDSAPLPVGDRLLVRGLIATLIPCKNGEELAKAPEFVQAVQSLAATAGGPAPLPAPPAVPGADDLKGLSGNALLAGIRGVVEPWKTLIPNWQKARDLAVQRRAAWDVVQALSRHAHGLAEADESRAHLEAILSNRLLLADVDPVAPVRATLTALLRQKVTSADATIRAAFDAAVVAVESSFPWQRLEADARKQILTDTRLLVPRATDVSNDEALIRELDGSSLSARATEAEAMPARAQRAIELAAKALEPTVRAFPVERATLRSSEDVRNWLERTEARLREAIQSGPILIN
jgi:hypothetical protein